jgi:hypothetical protein
MKNPEKLNLGQKILGVNCSNGRRIKKEPREAMYV